MISVAAPAWFGFVNRASAETVKSCVVDDEGDCPPGEYFQAESPIIKDFRIDQVTEQKNILIPVSGPYGGIYPPARITVTPGGAVGDSCISVVGPITYDDVSESNFIGFFLNYNYGDLTNGNFIVDTSACQSQVTTTARTFSSTLTINGSWRVCTSPSPWGGCQQYTNYAGSLPVSISVTLHPRLPLIGLIPSSLSLYITPFYPTANGSFTVKNTGDASTKLKWKAAQSLPAAAWFDFSPKGGSPLVAGASSQPLNVSVDGNLLTANGYIPGSYTSGITISDNGSTPIPAENTPQNLSVTLLALPPGVSTRQTVYPVIGPITLGRLTFSPVVLTAEISPGETTPPVLINNGYYNTGASAISLTSNTTEACTSNFFSSSPLLETQWPDVLNCPSSKGVYSGDLTFAATVCYPGNVPGGFTQCATQLKDTVKVPYTITVTANPVKAITDLATNVTFDSATLNGKVAANAPVWAGFQYSKMPFSPTIPGNFGMQTSLQKIASPGSGTNFSSNLLYVLDGSTYYYFRAVVYSEDLSETFYGSIMSFQTPAPPPITITCEQNCNFTAFVGGASAAYSLLVNTKGSYFSSFINPSCLLNGGSVGSCTTYTAFQAVVSVTESQNWLTLSPASLTAANTTSPGGFATSSFSMTINPGALAAGNYQDKVFVTVTESSCQGAGCTPSPIISYSRSIPVNLAVAGTGGGIANSTWKIFKKPNLLNAIQNFTCATNCNYTAAGLIAGDYQANLQITNSAGQTASAVKDFKVNPAISVASVAVTQADYCVSGPAATVNWTYSDSNGDSQSAYQVQVDDRGSAWNTPLTIDSGKVSGSGASYFTGDSIPPWAWQTTYKARVRVWDSQDAVSNWLESGSWTTPKHAYPIVNFTWSPSQPAVNQSVQFTDQTIFFDSGGAGQRAWNWLFKAPAPSPSSALQNPTYTYTDPGLYNVNLTATDKDGYTCALNKPISIESPIPIWIEVGPK